MTSVRRGLGEPSQQLVRSDVILLQKEGQPANYGLEWVVVLVRSLADLVEEVHVVEHTQLVFVQEPNESF